MNDDRLVLGPLLRYVDETTASVWVETRDYAQVAIQTAGQSFTAPTFAVHGHHYALVEVTGLMPGSLQSYTVTIDEVPVWPPPDSPYPPSRIATLKPGKDLRLAFGSCRTSVPHDAQGNRTHGVDALRAYAVHMASSDHDKWPDLVMFLGDQVYADETSEAMCAFIAARRDITEPPGDELKDYEEYAHLYKLAWSDPANRWLLSTLPSAMIFDDHDIRDDWNTSVEWRRRIHSAQWWRDRIVGGLGSYWVYQHLGNLSPSERAADRAWSQVTAGARSDVEVDLSDVLDDLGARVDKDPEAYRWSYARDIGSTRLVVVDSRAARVLRPEERSILDPKEMAWLDEQMQGGFDHLLIGTSLPFLLSTGLHQFEAWNEAVAAGVWGPRWSRWSEKLRQFIDLEHWAAFQEGFREVSRIITEVADGKRGPAPGVITFLSGDVHNSYVAEVDRSEGSRIVQAVCSPIRNPLPHVLRYATGFSSKNIGAGAFTYLARRAKVADPPLSWRTVHGPWFDNNLATLETRGRGLALRWDSGVVHGRDFGDPKLDLVASVDVDERHGAEPATATRSGQRYRPR